MWMSAFFLMHSLFSQASTITGSSTLEFLMDIPTEIGPPHESTSETSLPSRSKDTIVNNEMSSFFYTKNVFCLYIYLCCVVFMLMYRASCCCQKEWMNRLVI